MVLLDVEDEGLDPQQSITSRSVLGDSRSPILHPRVGPLRGDSHGTSKGPLTPLLVAAFGFALIT